MAAGEGGVRVDDVDFAAMMQVADSAENTGEEKSAGAGEAGAAGQREVANELCCRCGRVRLFAVTVDRLRASTELETPISARTAMGSETKHPFASSCTAWDKTASESGRKWVRARVAGSFRFCGEPL